MKKVLDACCGSRMFWFDKNDDRVIFMDIREHESILSDGRKLSVKPDVLGDFRKMEFDNSIFDMVVFDPPHLVRGGNNSWLVQKYGKLDNNNWKSDLTKGFKECFRVLKSNGILVFKWNEDQIKLSEVLECTDIKPMFGNKRPKQSKTHWLVFMK